MGKEVFKFKKEIKDFEKNLEKLQLEQYEKEKLLESIIEEIKDIIKTKIEYISIFSKYNTRAEGWLEGELLHRIHKNKDILNIKTITTKKNIPILKNEKKSCIRPDLHLILKENKELNIELKAFPVNKKRKLTAYFYDKFKFDKLIKDKVFLIAVLYSNNKLLNEKDYEEKVKEKKYENKLDCTSTWIYKNKLSIVISLWSKR